MKVQIVEVGPRDGLQDEAVLLNVEQKLWLIERLVSAGIRRIEIGAFVSPKWIPQMENSDQVVRVACQRFANQKVTFSALVPNERGMNDAVASGIREVAIFAACSESFSKKNINCTIDESFDRFKAVMSIAKEKKMRVRGYLSTAFGCPYEGKIEIRKVLKLVERMEDMGVFEVSVSDTIGVANPRGVAELSKKALKILGNKKLALHLHDTRGTALANVLSGLEQGVRIFDSSTGGLGGCPYAKGASGNLATEDLIYMLEKMGVKTGVQLEKLYSSKAEFENLMQKKLSSRALQAGNSKLDLDEIKFRSSRKR